MTEQPISPRELADQFNQPVNDVAYHVRVFRDMGVIELAGTRPVRGATPTFNRAVRRPYLSNEEIAELDPRKASRAPLNILQIEFADAAASLETKQIDATPEHYLFRITATLDEQGWHEFHAILAETVERLYEAETRCVDRRGENGEQSGRFRSSPT